MLVAIVGLAQLLGRQIGDEDRARLVEVAAGHARVIENTSLPPEDDVARRLAEVSGYQVFFRSGRAALHPELPPALTALPLADVPADGVAHRVGEHEIVALPIQGGRDLVVVGAVPNYWLDARVLSGIAALLAVAVLAAWLVVRNLVHPLRQLATRLPDIERRGSVDLPAARRNDELGDVVRSFLRTRQALQEEQDARQRAEKLAVLGRMTAALAHEVQNPVAAIRMHAQLWQRGIDEGAAAGVEAEVERIENLLNQWLFLTRPEPPAVAPLDLTALLRRIVAAHRPQAAHASAVVELEVEDGLVVRGDARRLEQVVRNLLTNALQAMPGGGRLRIAARADGDRVRITFADSGGGFSPTALQRFTEYFYSEREGGMGIGLAVANEIVKAHDGSLRAANAATGGAIVTVEIPIAGPASAATIHREP